MKPETKPAGCLSELDLMVFLDGELGAEETAAARAHLGRCFSCNRAYEALRRETEVIRAGVALVPASAANESRPRRELSWVIAAGFALSVGVVAIRRLFLTVSDAAAGTPLPDALPFLSNLGYTLLSLLDFRQIGTQLAYGGAFIMALIGLAAVSAVRRSPSRTAPALLAAALLPGLSFLAPPAEAFEVLRGDDCAIAADRVVNDDVLLMCERDANIAGTIRGDLYFLAQRVTITGRVEGDVMGISELLDIPGSVGLSVRGAAQRITVEGSVGRGLAFAGQRVTIGEGAEIGGAVLAACERIAVSGRVGRDLRAAAGHTTLNAPVGGDLRVVGEQMTLGPEARIEGFARFTGPEAPDRHARAGMVEWEQPEASGADPWGLAGSVAWGWAMAFLMGLALLLLAPKPVTAIAAVGTRPLAPLLFGILLFVGLPFAALLLAITVVGLPIAAVTAGLWLFLVYAARIAAALVIGQAILGLGATTGQRLARLALGLGILAVAYEVPVAGGVLYLLTMFFGLGCFAVWIWRSRSPAPAAVSGVSPAPPANPTPPAPPVSPA